MHRNDFRNNAGNFAARQQGYTLVELMIAGVLGLFLFASALSVFLSTSRTNSLQTAVSDLQERARFIQEYFNTEFERAGWTADPSWLRETVVQPLGFAANETGEDVTACGGSIATNCDRITIQYLGIRDCLGAQVNGGAIGNVSNTYFVQNGSLVCRGFNNAQGILLDNVDSFQILIGIDDSNDGGIPFSSESLLATSRNIDRYIEVDTPLNTNISIESIRYSILLRSADENALDEDTAAAFTLLNETALNFNDRHLRFQVTGTNRVQN